MDSTVIWVMALGVIVGAVLCCVIITMRQGTVMRGSLGTLQNQVAHLKEENKKFLKQGGMSSADTQHLLSQLEIQKEENEELSARVAQLEKELKAQQETVETVQQQAKTNSAKIAEGGRNVGNPAGGAGASGEASDPTKGVQSKDVTQIYEEILSTLKAQSSVVQPPAGSPGMYTPATVGGPPGSPIKRQSTSVSFGSPALGVSAGGLSLVLPQPFTVYQEISSGLYHGGQFRKFEHHVRLGESSGDVELVFYPVKGKRRIGGGLKASSTSNAGGASPVPGGNSPDKSNNGASTLHNSNKEDELVFSLPSLREIKLDSDGTLPDGPSMKVSLTTKTAPTPHQLMMMGPQSTAGNRTTASLQASLSRRRKDAFSTVEDCTELDNQTFIFQASWSPSLDEWSNFVTEHCGDCVVYPAL